MKKELPFEKLMSYADGCLERAEAAHIASLLENDPISQELVEGLKAIYVKEGKDSRSLERGFVRMEKHFDRKIHTHTNFSNHLIDLNRQLRVAAAVFVLLISCSILMGFGTVNRGEKQNMEQHGPYDLAMGSKIAP